MQRFSRAALDAGLSMVRDGLIPAHSFWGTTSLEGVTADGDIAGVTTTSGLAWKIPGRTGDSPILGAGLYVDGDVGAAGQLELPLRRSGLLTLFAGQWSVRASGLRLELLVRIDLA